MHTNGQPSSPQKIMHRVTIVNPTEQQRRLWKVYALLLVLAEQAEASADQTHSHQPQPAN